MKEIIITEEQIDITGRHDVKIKVNENLSITIKSDVIKKAVIMVLRDYGLIKV